MQATSIELRESLIAQRIARVQPLPAEAGRWIAGEQPLAHQARVSLIGNLVEHIAAGNSQPYPYLTICAFAYVLPFFRQAKLDRQHEQASQSLHALCGLISLSHLRVVIEEEWKVLSEEAQHHAWKPTYFSSEYLTVNMSIWCRELASRSLLLLGERSSITDRQNSFDGDDKQWESDFRTAERLLFLPENAKDKKFLSALENSQRIALSVLLDRAKTAMSLDFHLESASKETSEDEEILGEAEISEVDAPELTDERPNVKSTLGTPVMVDSRPLSSTHPAIEGYFDSLADNGLRDYLESLLSEARNLETPLNLVIIRELKASEPTSSKNSFSSKAKSVPRVWLERVCDGLVEPHDDSDFYKLVSISSGELIYVQGGGDRLKLMPMIRLILDQTAALFSKEVVSVDGESEVVPNGLVAGLASVGRPNKSFRSLTLLQASIRCLEAAKRQGAGAIKSIEVF